jgi:TolB-like protein/Tfp pilus assembly protein PilF
LRVERPRSRSDGFRLGEHWVDPVANEISDIRIDAKSMAVLCALVEAAPAVVTHAMLLARVWPGVTVVDNVIHQAISQLRRVLGDGSAEPRFIETVPRRGYRLVASVVSSADVAVAPQSILILPFKNLGTRQSAYFAAGVHEDLLARLSRIHGLNVISSVTALAMTRLDDDVAAMAALADSEHVLVGSIRLTGARVRLAVQLLAMPQGRVVWAECYDRATGDVFAVQDELAEAIAVQLRIRLNPALLADFARAQTRNLQAYDLVLRAREAKSKSPCDVNLTTSYLERALALDPNYADAYGWLASVAFPVQAHGLSWDEVRSKAIANIERALSLDPDNVPGLAAMAYYVTREERSASAGLKYLARALRVAPGNSLIHSMYGIRLNGYEERLVHVRQAYRLDPFFVDACSNYALLLLEHGQPQQALEVVTNGMRGVPDSAQLAATLAEVYFAEGDSIAGLLQARRAAQMGARGSSFALRFVEHLFAANLDDAAWRWLDAVAGPAPLGSPAGWLRARQMLAQNQTDALAAEIENWVPDTENEAHALLLRALLAGRRADIAMDCADRDQCHAQLLRAVAHFGSLFSMFRDVETPGCRAQTKPFPGNVITALLHYLRASAQARDAPRTEAITAHIRRILDEQVPPTGAALQRALFAALCGDIPVALDACERALVPGYWTIPTLAAFGVLHDPIGVFHGLGGEPRLQRLIADERQRSAALKVAIAKEAPGLMDPRCAVEPQQRQENGTQTFRQSPRSLDGAFPTASDSAQAIGGGR